VPTRMSRYQLISTTCDSRESHEHRLGWVLLNICSNFRLPRLRPRLCIRSCIFYYILELRGLCFGRCVQIVCGLVKLLFCSLYPLEDLFRPYNTNCSKPNGIRRSIPMWTQPAIGSRREGLDCRALMARRSR
jgi:hypothetical protein